MRLSSLSIIFIVIILPLTIVLSTYMQLQIDVLNQKEDYSTKLLDSTYDGILSFELNSLDIDNATGHSVKAYVEDAVSTFFNTMNINMGSSGASESNIQAYVPAILFTTYDGYYIYSPVKTMDVHIDYDNSGIATTDDYDEVEYEYKDSEGNYITGYSQSGNNVKYTINDKATSYNYMVKSFCYYSALYSTSDYNLVVNYSLDNHVALYGQYTDSNGDDRTITKSGYLVSNSMLGNTSDTSEKIEIEGSFLVSGTLDNSVDMANDSLADNILEIPVDSLTTDEWTTLIECYDANYANRTIVRNDEGVTYDDADNYTGIGYYIKDGNTYIIRGQKSNGVAVNSYSGKMFDTVKESDAVSYAGQDPGGDIIIDYTLAKEVEDNTTYIKVKVGGCEITDTSAKEYYLKAYFFSNWVKNELSSLVKIEHLKNSYYDSSSDELYSTTTMLASNQGMVEYNYQDKFLFSFDDDEDYDSESSIFYQHKIQVIQNSIQYNLNSAISTYNANYAGSTDFSMPVFSSTDWDKILNKISMAVFMQGVPCGTTTWGDYAIATSTNNKVFVNKRNLYFVAENYKNDKRNAYHYIDCDQLLQDVIDSTSAEVYADMSYEYAYDSEDVSAVVYCYDMTKYYYYLEEWYYYNGLKASDSDSTKLTDGLSSGDTIQVGSAYYEDGKTGLRYVAYLINGGIYSSNKDTGVFETIYATPMDEDTGTLSEDVTLYDHMNVDCYWCMLSSNYGTFDFQEVIDDTSGKYSNAQKDAAIKIKKAWYTYIAKYRNDQFNTTDAINR